jgi:uncharacterized membrane protein
MLNSILIGLVAGQRAMTPLAVVAGAARQGKLAEDAPLAKFIAHPLIAGGAVALAAAEMAGDKMKTAPNRTVIAGLAARSLTSAYAGAVLAPKGRRVLGGAAALVTALASSHAGLAARLASMRRYGQTGTGFVEDAAVVAGGLAATGLIGKRAGG